MVRRASLAATTVAKKTTKAKKSAMATKSPAKKAAVAKKTATTKKATHKKKASPKKKADPKKMVARKSAKKPAATRTSRKTASAAVALVMETHHLLIRIRMMCDCDEILISARACKIWHQTTHEALWLAACRPAALESLIEPEFDEENRVCYYPAENALTAVLRGATGADSRQQGRVFASVLQLLCGQECGEDGCSGPDYFTVVQVRHFTRTRSMYAHIRILTT